MRQRTVRGWKPRPFSDLYRPLEEKRKLLLENYRARGPADQGLREIFPGCFLDAALSLLDTCVSYFPAALLSMFNRLLRQRVGGHSRETFGMEMKNSIIQCVFNEGPPYLGQGARPSGYSSEQSHSCPPGISSLVGGTENSTGKTLQQKL